MSNIAERLGFAESRAVIQVDSLDDDTRRDMWNTMHQAISAIGPAVLRNPSRRYGDHTTISGDFARRVATAFLRVANDDFRGKGETWAALRQRVESGPYWDALLCAERLGQEFDRSREPEIKAIGRGYWGALNYVFETEMVGFRAVDGHIVESHTSTESDAISRALADAAPFAGVREHLDQAVTRLAKKPAPDLAGSVDASISAVEGVVRAVTAAKDLSKGLKALEAKGIKPHGAFRDGLDKLYGYTSDEKGVRHGSIEKADLDRATATLMLVTCSAFVSWFIEEGRKAGLL